MFIKYSQFIQKMNLGGGNPYDKDVLSKAKLYTKLARNSKNKSDQFSAYNKAIEMLKNDQNVYVTNVIFELSTWLYKNNYPYERGEKVKQLLESIFEKNKPFYLLFN